MTRASKSGQRRKPRGVPLRRRAEPPHVALIVETSLAYGRGLLHGIGRYIRENGPWSVYLEQRSLYDPAPPWLRHWRGDGIISRASSPAMAKLILDVGVPTVDLNEEVIGLGLPGIFNDHYLIGEMAANHFMERGFTHFGFLGFDWLDWSNRRRAGFERALATGGFSVDAYHFAARRTTQAAPPPWEKELESVTRWIAKLPKPAGVMACNDFRAVQLLDACRRAVVAVPEQVAVLGVDNEDFAAELCNPPLTSIVPDADRIGYEAARLLDRMMRRGESVMLEMSVPPRGIVTRQSTDITAIRDPIVAGAIHFIRQHACEGISVDDVIAQSSVSRSVLQRRFRELLRRSIHDVILSVRIDRVKRLLADTTLALPDIAKRTGFNHSEYLSVVFKQRVGQTVSQYRGNAAR